MLDLEQPVGTGFSQGTPSAVTEQDVAHQFMGFWRNFVDTFDLGGRKVFITGESYAGMYVPYLADAMLDANNTHYFNVEATMIYDPLINNNAVMRQVPTVAFVEQWNGLLNLNDTFMKQLYANSKECGYDGFLEKYLQYPPTKTMPPPPGGSIDPQGQCDLWGAVINATTYGNPVSNCLSLSN